MNFSEARKNMVECQLRTNGITNQKIVQAFMTIPREDYYPAHLASCAYLDEDVCIANDRWALEPLVEARMMSAAQLAPTDVVLLVGASSMTLTAYLSQIVTTVIVIDEDAALLDQAQAIAQKHEIGNVAYIHSPMTQGYAEEAPYDVIILSGAVCEVPNTLFSQIVDGGRLACIEKKHEKSQGDLKLYKKMGLSVSGSFLGNANTPFLKGFAPTTEFEF